MLKERHLEILWWDGSIVGHLVNRGAIYFVYDEAWIERGHNLSPIGLPFTPIAFNGAKGMDGLPGLIADCLPDGWGRKVAAKEFAANKWGEPTTLALLAWRGNGGLGALNFQPALGDHGRPLNKKLELLNAAALARGAAAIERGDPSDILPLLARGGSAGGAQPKALVVAYDDGTFSVGEADSAGRPCIIKFDTSPRGGQAACEHAYSHLAQAAGIQSTHTELVYESAAKSRSHLLIRRFDVPDAPSPHRRLHFHSLSGLLQKGPGTLDYTDLFRTALRLGVAPKDIREVARRMVFNVLASNSDDHAKNHAFLYDESSKRWSLTPAYDLTFHSMMLERGMSIRGEVWPSIQTMQELCAEVNIASDEFRSITQDVTSAVNRWNDFAEASGVPQALRREIAERHGRIHQSVVKDGAKR